MKSNFGKYTYVDLGKREVKDYVIPEEWYEKYLGGRGIAARILLEELNPKVDPFSEENILVFASGPFQGLGVAGGSRFLVTGKSPKTKNLNDSFCGGKFGDKLGKSGFDGIIISGKSKNPVYISVDNGKTQILSAEDLWGLDPKQVEETIGKKYKDCSIACIGKAGEKEVLQSCIILDKRRAIGRPGYGAIMGSKNLKAVVVSGKQKKELANEEKFNKLRKDFSQKIKNCSFPQNLNKYGTSGDFEFLNDLGMVPTKNFQNGQYLYASRLSGQSLVKSNVWVKNETCTGCPIFCKRVVSGVFNDENFESEWGGPEYETIAALGSNLLNDNLESICLFNKKCNQYGLDTISVGVHISYLMEATEKGLLKKEDQIKWGDTKRISELIDKIANREGIGDWIARGVEFITNKVGDNSFFIHCKGEEVAMHDPRGKYSMAIYYATSPRGGNHMSGVHDPTPPHKELNLSDNLRHSWENRAKIAGEYQRLRSFANSLIMCCFTSNLPYVEGEYLYPLIREMLEAATGKSIDIKEMLTIGERNYDLTRIFAEKAGYTRADDKLPQRFHEAQPSTGYVVDKDMFNRTVDEYYKIYGYDKYGPSKERIKQLNIT
jgi:aldehyde:ferredoxin oxidoreductase